MATRTTGANPLVSGGKNYFQNLNLAAGIPGTTFDATYENSTQENICGTIELLGGTLDGTDSNQLGPLLMASLAPRIPSAPQLLTTSGTLTVPAGVTVIKRLLLWGGGGSGAYQSSATSAGGGGGGALCVAYDVPVTAGANLTYVIGAGGAALGAGGPGNPGGATSIVINGTTYSAGGGGGGSSVGIETASATASGGLLNILGAAGRATSSTRCGDGGSSPHGGSGGSGAQGQGANGTSPGGGGAGTTVVSSGAGAAGAILVEWG